MIIDSHCHLDFQDFDHDRASVIASCQQKNIIGFMVPAVSPDYWPRQFAISAQYPQVVLALGLHPWFVSQQNIDELHRIVDLTAESSLPVLAIGETGLDKYRGDPQLQLISLRAQLQLAKELDKPVVLHSVKTHALLQQELKAFPGVKGVIHGFSGSYEEAMRFVGMGYKLGIGGVITRPQAHKIRTALIKLPADTLVLETDAPDMNLYRNPDTRNTPENLTKILSCLAELRQENAKDLEESLLASTIELFAWPPLV